MATISITDWDTKKNIEVDANTTSPGSGKVQPVILDGSLNEGTTGNGSIGYNTSDIDTTDTQSKLESIVFTDSDESTTKDYEVENPEDLGTTTDVTVWVYDSAWTADGTVQLVLGTGTGDGSDYSVTGIGNNPWANGQNTEGAWHLNESSGPTIDSTLNNYDSTSTTGTVYDVASQFNGGREFDGIDDFIEFGTDFSSLGYPFTVNYWINSSQSGYTGQKAVTAAFANGNGWYTGLGTVDTEGEIIQFMGDSSNAWFITTDQTYNDGNWHLITVKYVSSDPNDAEILVDGQNVATTVQSGGTASYTTNNNFEIGRRDSGNEYDGVADEIKLYSKNLSLASHQAEYDASPAGGQVFFSQQAAETTGVTISAPVSQGTSATPNPTVTAGNVNIAAPVTEAKGVTPNPTIDFDQFISAPVSTGNAVSPTPTLTAGNATINAPVTNAAGVTPNPGVQIGNTISAPVSTATGTTPNPSVTGGGVQINAPVSTATGTTPEPTIIFDQFISVKVSTGNAVTPAPTLTAGPVTIQMPVSTATGTTPAPQLIRPLEPRDSSVTVDIKKQTDKTVSGDINK